MRGHGDSAPPNDPKQIGIQAFARDWESLLQIEKPNKIISLSHSMGVQVALELRYRTPQLPWIGLVLTCGTFEHTASNVGQGQLLERALPFLRGAATIGGKRLHKVWSRLMRLPLNVHLARMTEMSQDLSRKRDIQRYFTHLSQMNPQLFINMLFTVSEHSARIYLGELDTPTLVIAGEKDHFTPASISIEMAELLPNAQLQIISDGTHAAPVEHTIEVNQLIRRFIDQCLI